MLVKARHLFKKARAVVRDSKIVRAYYEKSAVFEKAVEMHAWLQTAIRLFMFATALCAFYVGSFFWEHRAPIAIEPFDRFNLTMGLLLSNAVPFFFIASGVALSGLAFSFIADVLGKNDSTKQAGSFLLITSLVLALAGGAASLGSATFVQRFNNIELASENHAARLVFQIRHLNGYQQAILLSAVSGDPHLQIPASLKHFVDEYGTLEKPDQAWIGQILRAEIRSAQRRLAASNLSRR